MTQSKSMIEGTVKDFTFIESPPQLILKLRTAEGDTITIDYKVHHSWFGQMRTRLQRGATIKTAYYHDKTDQGFVGIPIIEAVE